MIHENQKTCGDAICKAFIEEKHSHVLLLAQMQMGKSGTYWDVIFRMLMNPDLSIDNVLLISGNREIELREQVIKDKRMYCKWALEKYLTENAHIEKAQLKKMKSNFKVKCEDNIKIIWGSQLIPKKCEPYNVKDNTLIVWDEAHFAQSEKNSPDKWFKHNDIEGLLTGVDIAKIKQRNICLLNVSATPFSELIVQSEKHIEYDEPFHKIIKLLPTPSYCGVKKYMEKGRILKSVPIDYENVHNISNILDKYVDHDSPKYMLFRVNDTTISVNVLKQICDSKNIDCKLLNSTVKDIKIDDMVDEPVRPTLIIITGMLRMGKVLPKDHVCMVFESVTKNNQKKTDTGLQGLLGRVCGYSSSEEGFNIDIYIEESILHQIKIYLDGYESSSGPCNDNSMNVKKTTDHRDVKLSDNVIHHILPIKLPISEEDKMNLIKESTGGIIKKKMKKWLIKNTSKIDMSNLCENEKTMLRNKLSKYDDVDSMDIKFKSLHSKNSKMFCANLIKSVKTHTPSFKNSENIEEDVVVTISMWNTLKLEYPAILKEKGGESDIVWLTMKYKGEKRIENKEYVNVPPSLVNKKCVFLPKCVNVKELD